MFETQSIRLFLPFLLLTTSLVNLFPLKNDSYDYGERLVVSTDDVDYGEKPAIQPDDNYDYNEPEPVNGDKTTT